MLFVRTSQARYTINVLASVGLSVIMLLLTHLSARPLWRSVGFVVLAFLLAYRCGEYLLTGKSLRDYKLLLGPEVSGNEARLYFYINLASLCVLALLAFLIS